MNTRVRHETSIAVTGLLNFICISLRSKMTWKQNQQLLVKLIILYTFNLISEQQTLLQPKS